MKWIIAIVCLLVIGFSAFGFMATFEPGVPNAIAFRIGYAVLSLACALGLMVSFIPRSKR